MNGIYGTHAPHVQYFLISFQYDNEIILQFDWLSEFEEWSKYLNLVHQAVISHMHITGT